MKDLVQEGRKIQETFKTNVVNEDSFPKTKEEVEKILKKFSDRHAGYSPFIGNYTINADLTVDVMGGVQLNGFNLTKIPVKFGKVSGGFYCYNNQLRTLEGAPREVGGHFMCWGNKLTSLEGAPQKVDGAFDCRQNNLTSLEGAPKKVGEHFNCANNKLTSLKGAPKEVGYSSKGLGFFRCSSNKLTSLEGAPQKVRGEFHCTANKELPTSEKRWARKNIKAESFKFR